MGLDDRVEGEADDATSSEPESLPFVELMPVMIDDRIELEIDGVTIRVSKDFEAVTFVRGSSTC